MSGKRGAMGEEDIYKWALPDLATAVDWSEPRISNGISVALDALGEYAKTAEQADQAATKYLEAIEKIQTLDSSSVGVAVKLSALGLTFDKERAETLAREIVKAANHANVPVEIDTEGTPTVGATCQVAKSIADDGFQLVLALQAYLNRTEEDMASVVASGVKVRLIKGAYLGDTKDFFEIQNRFIRLFELALETKQPFDVGTHDPELITIFTRQLSTSQKELVTFGFLKGLADKTKLSLAKEGFRVAEYVPYGENRKGYIIRREAYLKNLNKLEREPAP
jgi:proline dehydrogenase